MVKVGLEIIKKFANFALVCPFPKVNRTLTNVLLNENLFPPIFPSIHFRLFLYLSAQVPGIKSMKEMFNYALTGELERT